MNNTENPGGKLGEQSDFKRLCLGVPGTKLGGDLGEEIGNDIYNHCH